MLGIGLILEKRWIGVLEERSVSLLTALIVQRLGPFEFRNGSLEAKDSLRGSLDTCWFSPLKRFEIATLPCPPSVSASCE